MSPLTSTPSSVVSFIVLSLHMSSKMVTNCARARRVKDSIAVLDWKAMVFRSFERVLRLDCVKRLIADGCWGYAPHCIFTEISFNFFLSFSGLVRKKSHVSFSYKSQQKKTFFGFSGFCIFSVFFVDMCFFYLLFWISLAHSIIPLTRSRRSASSSVRPDWVTSSFNSLKRASASRASS